MNIFSATVGVALIAMSATMLNAQTALPAWALGPFVRPVDAKPVIAPNTASVFDCPMRKMPIHWEATHTFNPAAIVRDGKVFILYRAEDDLGKGIGGHTSRLGLADSDDGIHFNRHPAPVLFPAEDDQKSAEWEGGCEDPRLVESPDGTYVLTYTQWNRKMPRLAIATSTDLLNWKKFGSAFADASDGKYAKQATKSAGIVTKLVDGRLIAAKIGDHFLMYYGERNVHLATSPDLIHWTPVEDHPGQLANLIPPRAGKFDSSFAEVGPPPVLNDHGILLIYNGVNGPHGDPGIGDRAYSDGQILFDAAQPTRVLARLDHPFFKPDLPWEKTGQYAAGTTFAEGLVVFKGRWFLYYGCADSFVGVAIKAR
jgi:predicted GH43/DUF377 family glycosyl hydrolase